MQRQRTFEGRKRQTQRERTLEEGTGKGSELLKEGRDTQRKRTIHYSIVLYILGITCFIRSIFDL
jgi:hypothetical protein